MAEGRRFVCHLFVVYVHKVKWYINFWSLKHILMSVLNLHSSSIPNPNVFFIFIIHYRLIFALEYRHESAEVARKLPFLMSAKGPQKWRWHQFRAHFTRAIFERHIRPQFSRACFERHLWEIQFIFSAIFERNFWDQVSNCFERHFEEPFSSAIFEGLWHSLTKAATF